MRRCICGEAKSYPVCDGSHVGKNWSCKRESTSQVAYASISSMHYRSLAQKWAHHHKGIVVEEQDEDTIFCQQLWIFCDGSDADSIVLHRNRVVAQKVTLVAISISYELLFALGPFDSILHIGEDKKGSLWLQLQQAENQDPKSTTPQNIFLSHAVVDEGRWIPVLDEFRHQLGHKVFSCSDSILSGSNWYEEIIGHLRDCDWVLCLISEGFRKSTFCAFEVGMARALQKPILMMSIDGVPPPSYAQDVQMEVLERYCATHPWLTLEEGLVECMLRFASIRR